MTIQKSLGYFFLFFADIRLYNLFLHLGNDTLFWLDLWTLNFQSLGDALLGWLLRLLAWRMLCFVFSLFVFAFRAVDGLNLQLSLLLLFFFNQLISQLFVSAVILLKLLFVEAFFLLFFVNQVFEQILWINDGLPAVEIFDVLQGFHEFHFPLGIIRLVL